MENVQFGGVIDNDDYKPYRRGDRSPPRDRSPSRKQEKSRKRYSHHRDDYRSKSPEVKRTFVPDEISPARITIRNDKYRRSPSPSPPRYHDVDLRDKIDPPRSYKYKTRSKSPEPKKSPPGRKKSPKRKSSEDRKRVRSSEKDKKSKMRSDPEGEDLPEPKKRYERSKSPIAISDDEDEPSGRKKLSEKDTQDRFDHIENAFKKLKEKKDKEKKKNGNLPPAPKMSKSEVQTLQIGIDIDFFICSFNTKKCHVFFCISRFFWYILRLIFKFYR